MTLLGNVRDGRVDGQADLWDLNVLLQVQEAHLKLRDLFLHRRGHFIAVPEKTETSHLLVRYRLQRDSITSGLSNVNADSYPLSLLALSSQFLNTASFSPWCYKH